MFCATLKTAPLSVKLSIYLRSKYTNDFNRTLHLLDNFHPLVCPWSVGHTPNFVVCAHARLICRPLIGPPSPWLGSDWLRPSAESVLSAVVSTECSEWCQIVQLRNNSLSSWCCCSVLYISCLLLEAYKKTIVLLKEGEVERSSHQGIFPQINATFPSKICDPWLVTG